MSKKFPGGVITGDGVQAIFNDAQENEYALPAVNVVGSNTVNAVLETAAEVNSPVMIQFSNGGGVFNAGKSLSNEGQKAAIAVRYQELCMYTPRRKPMMCSHFAYRSLCVNFTLDRWTCGCRREILRKGRKSLYSSHMLDLSKNQSWIIYQLVENISCG